MLSSWAKCLSARSAPEEVTGGVARARAESTACNHHHQSTPPLVVLAEVSQDPQEHLTPRRGKPLLRGGINQSLEKCWQRWPKRRWSLSGVPATLSHGVYTGPWQTKCLRATGTSLVPFPANRTARGNSGFPHVRKMLRASKPVASFSFRTEMRQHLKCKGRPSPRTAVSQQSSTGQTAIPGITRGEGSTMPFLASYITMVSFVLKYITKRTPVPPAAAQQGRNELRRVL